PFRDLELVPRFPVPGLPQIGYDSREPARHAERVGLGLGNRPVTDVLPAVIRAETIQTPLRHGQRRSPSISSRGIEGAHESQVRQECQRALAIDAPRILEKDELLAVVAMKHLHRW